MGGLRSRLARFVLSAAPVVLGLCSLGCRRQVDPAGDSSRPAPALPVPALSPATAAAVVRIELERPDADDPAGRSKIVLQRRDDAWYVTEPLRARASADKVAALLGNLQQLRIGKRLDAGTTFYDRYDLTPAKALHVIAETAGRKKVVDFLAGKSSDQGQLVRLPGSPGLFTLVNEGPHGYQGFLYTRDLRSWRDPGLLSFDEADVESVEIANPHGDFAFTRRDGVWTGTFAPRGRGGRARSAPRSFSDFDGARVDEMLRAYHALAADDFGEPADGAGAGVQDAVRTGGRVRLRLGPVPRVLTLRVGGPAPERSRFAVAGGRWAALEDGDDDDLYVLSPWTARWALGDARTFQRPRAVPAPGPP